MKLLIITQKVDKNDPVLGFFHRWIEKFSKHCEKLTVICLEKGEHNLPHNVTVLSLGKESLPRSNLGIKRLLFTWRFWRHIWKERNNHDTVFVHMNQEYVILGWKLWKLLGKKVWLWRNHAQGNFFTTVAVLVSNRVFCTSPQSYTAKFKKTELMPVGIDTEFFKPDPSVEKIPNSILFLGRIAPVKRVLEFLEWLNSLDGKVVTVAGDALPKDRGYFNSVKKMASNKVKFVGAVNHEQALKLYQSHETYVNFTPSGSMDKTILEAAACETRVVVRNDDLKVLEDKRGSDLRNYVIENHSLDKLTKMIFENHDRI